MLRRKGEYACCLAAGTISIMGESSAGDRRGKRRRREAGGDPLAQVFRRRHEHLDAAAGGAEQVGQVAGTAAAVAGGLGVGDDDDAGVGGRVEALPSFSSSSPPHAQLGRSTGRHGRLDNRSLWRCR